MSAKVATTKKSAKKAVAKSSTHPPVASMVRAAIGELKEKKGSSLVAIKKYILANYKGVDMTRTAPFIRRYLKKAVAEGVISQKKGSFLAGSKSEAKPKKATSAVKKSPTKKAATAVKKSAVKKPTKAGKKTPGKKSATAKKTSAAKKAPVAKKSPKKSIRKPVAKKMAKKPVTKKSTGTKK